mgnify:CR=1 FL=1
MKITYLKTNGFRKFEDTFETEIYDITEITGGNAKGKTTILYAIIWAFLGTNLTGDDKVWLGNKKCEGCYVELHFIDNARNNHILIRYKNRYDNKMNFIMLDNKKIEQKDLQTFYKDKKLFLSILNLNYFLHKKPTEQKELIDNYLPEIDIKEVYKKLSDYEKTLLEGCPTNMGQYIQELNDNKKMYENHIKTIQGKIDYAQTIIDSTPLGEMLNFEKEEELNLDRQHLSYLTTDKNNGTRTKQEKIVNELEKQKLSLEKQIDELFSKMQEGKKKYLSIKNSVDAYCPLCQQKLEEKGKLTTIINMKKDLEESYNKKIKLDKELLIIKSKLSVEKAKLHSVKSVTNNEEYPGQITTLREKISTLEQEKMDIEKHNNIVTINQKNVMTAKEDITKFNIKIQELHGLIENIKKVKDIAQKLYINYLEEKMKYATKHLKNVKIQYYKVSKEDEILKEDFIILYKNNELKNLSRSETIATMLEIGNMLNKVANTNFPLFIDDSESCADFNFIEDYAKDTQILISRVQKSQDLTISNYNDKAMQIAA